MKILVFEAQSGIAGDMTFAALYHLLLKIEGCVIKKRLIRVLDDLSSMGKVTVSHSTEGVQVKTSNELPPSTSIKTMMTLLERHANQIKLSNFHFQVTRKILHSLAEAEMVVHSIPEIMNEDDWNPSYFHFKRRTDQHSLMIEVTIARNGRKKIIRRHFSKNFMEKEHFHLHEASDILLDSLLVGWCLQQLDVNKNNTKIYLIPPIRTGSGQVTFSHGTFKVPVPAVKYLLDTHRIPHAEGSEKRELTTPTGAAILASLKPSVLNSNNFEQMLKMSKEHKLKEKAALFIGKGLGFAKLKNENALNCYLIKNGKNLHH